MHSNFDSWYSSCNFYWNLGIASNSNTFFIPPSSTLSLTLARHSIVSLPSMPKKRGSKEEKRKEMRGKFVCFGSSPFCLPSRWLAVSLFSSPKMCRRFISSQRKRNRERKRERSKALNYSQLLSTHCECKIRPLSSLFLSLMSKRHMFPNQVSVHYPLLFSKSQKGSHGWERLVFVGKARWLVGKGLFTLRD